MKEEPWLFVSGLEANGAWLLEVLLPWTIGAPDHSNTRPLRTHCHQFKTGAAEAATARDSGVRRRRPAEPHPGLRTATDRE